MNNTASTVSKGSLYLFKKLKNNYRYFFEAVKDTAFSVKKFDFREFLQAQRLPHRL
jgi:hypothetical protein